MAIEIIGPSGAKAETDLNKNLFTRDGLSEYGSVGGGFTVSGWTTGVVAAALAANTNLMSMRFSASSTRKAYIKRLFLTISIATVGASGGVAGTLAWQKFTTQTPTGGTARTPLRKNAATGSGTDMTDVRDSNAALTGTAPTWTEIAAATQVPVSTVGYVHQHWWSAREAYEPIVLIAGDGIGLRTLVAMAATQTWMFSYTVDWIEK